LLLLVFLNPLLVHAGVAVGVAKGRACAAAYNSG
jgi:hypothetical protein